MNVLRQETKPFHNIFTCFIASFLYSHADVDLSLDAAQYWIELTAGGYQDIIDYNQTTLLAFSPYTLMSHAHRMIQHCICLYNG